MEPCASSACHADRCVPTLPFTLQVDIRFTISCERIERALRISVKKQQRNTERATSEAQTKPQFDRADS